MATRPDKFPFWARTAADPAGINEPSEGKKDTGWIAEQPAFQFANWLLNRIALWLKFFFAQPIQDWIPLEVYEIGDIRRDTVDNKQYRVTTAHTGDATLRSNDAANWQQFPTANPVNELDDLSDVNLTPAPILNDRLLFDGAEFKAVAEKNKTYEYLEAGPFSRHDVPRADNALPYARGDLNPEFGLGWLNSGAWANLIINPNGITNQRSAVTAIDGAYYVDRWKCLIDGAQTMDISQPVQDIIFGGKTRRLKTHRITNNNAGTDINVAACQYVENLDLMNLRDSTVSMLVRVISKSDFQGARLALLRWTGGIDSLPNDPILTWPAGPAGTATFVAGFTVLSDSVIPAGLRLAPYRTGAIEIGTDAQNLAIVIYTTDPLDGDAGDFLAAGNAMVIVGGGPVPEFLPEPGAELSKMFRFHQTGALSHVGQGSNGQAQLTAYSLKSKMRAVPTTALLNVSTTNISVIAANPRGVGEFDIVWTPNSNGVHDWSLDYSIDAEL